MRWRLFAALLLMLGTPALAQDGEGTLSGPAKGKVTHCGSDRSQVTWDFEASAGTWDATVSGGPGYSGTVTPMGSSGSLANLAFDAQSKTTFDAWLTALASSACGAQITLTQPSSISKFSLKLNKRHTLAKLSLSATAMGSGPSGSGNGKVKMMLRGSWQDVVP